MSDMSAGPHPGQVPGQTALLDGRTAFTEAYAFIPRRALTDIVTSRLPHFEATRAWILARPMTGFSETFCQYVLEIDTGGGSHRPEPDRSAEAALYVTGGVLDLTVKSDSERLETGDFAYVPPGADWSIHNRGRGMTRLIWIRKRYVPLDDLGAPSTLVVRGTDVIPEPMPGTTGEWSTSCFIDPGDIRHDLNVNVVSFAPGAVIPFLETHVMEHGLYVLEGKGVYRLNRDWIEVETGDFMWLRAFCPQACYAGGSSRFRYLLYKDVNRHPGLGISM